MKKILIILFLVPLLCRAQEVFIERYDLKLETSFYGNELKYIDSIFNASEISVFITKLLPDCQGKNCYEKSMIREELDVVRSKQDSKFLGEYFTGVNYELIDSSSIIQLDSSDFQFCLKEILKGPRELAEDESVDMCYNPRHAVIFKNGKGEIFAIQEICFECGHTKVAIYTSEIQHNTSSPFKYLFMKYKLTN